MKRLLRWLPKLLFLITALLLDSCSDLSQSGGTVKADVQAKASTQGLAGIREQQNRFWE
jgi:hypothetical protein